MPMRAKGRTQGCFVVLAPAVWRDLWLERVNSNPGVLDSGRSFFEIVWEYLRLQWLWEALSVCLFLLEPFKVLEESSSALASPSRFRCGATGNRQLRTPIYVAKRTSMDPYKQKCKRFESVLKKRKTAPNRIFNKSRSQDKPRSSSLRLLLSCVCGLNSRRITGIVWSFRSPVVSCSIRCFSLLETTMRPSNKL